MSRQSRLKRARKKRTKKFIQPDRDMAAFGPKRMNEPAAVRPMSMSQFGDAQLAAEGIVEREDGSYGYAGQEPAPEDVPEKVKVEWPE